MHLNDDDRWQHAYDGIILMRNWPFAGIVFQRFSVSIAWIQSTWERRQSAAAAAAVASPFSNQTIISIAPPLCIDAPFGHWSICSRERIKFVRLRSHYTYVWKACCAYSMPWYIEHENTAFFPFRIGSTRMRTTFSVFVSSWFGARTSQPGLFIWFVQMKFKKKTKTRICF